MEKELRAGWIFICKTEDERKRIWGKLKQHGYPTRNAIDFSFDRYPNIAAVRIEGGRVVFSLVSPNFLYTTELDEETFFEEEKPRGLESYSACCQEDSELKSQVRTKYRTAEEYQPQTGDWVIAQGEERTAKAIYAFTHPNGKHFVVPEECERTFFEVEVGGEFSFLQAISIKPVPEETMTLAQVRAALKNPNLRIID
jgi:hypothetical protein